MINANRITTKIIRPVNLYDITSFVDFGAL